MVPEGWKLTSLKEICSGQLQTGPFGSQLHASEYTNNGISVLMPKDLIGFRANIETAARITIEKANDLSKHILKDGDLLFSRRGDVTRFALIDAESKGSLCGTGCLKATPSEKHSSLFLSYFLQKDAVKRWLEQNAVGQTMLNLNTVILSELPLMMASTKTEEIKIAKILTVWDKAIETAEKLIENSRAQKKALMQQLLTGKKRFAEFEGKWEEVKLVEVLDEFINGFAFTASNYQKSGIPIITMGNIGLNGEFNERTEKSNYWESKPELAKYLIRKGDLLIAMTDVTPDKNLIGRMTIVNVDKEFYLNQRVGHLKFKSTVDKQFIMYLANHSGWRKYTKAVSASGVQANLSTKDIKLGKIRLPSTEEQQKIALVLTNADKEIETLEQQLSDFKQEKKALMQQLLTGKRRVTVDTTSETLC